jgi:hypothetical protein
VIDDLITLHCDRTSFVASFSGPNLNLSLGCLFSRSALGRARSQAFLQHLHGDTLVLVLAAFRFAPDDRAGRHVLEHNGAVRLVPMLPAWPGAAHRQELHIIIVKHRLWRALIAHHGDRDGAAVHTTVAFCRRDTLPPVTAGLIRERRLCALAVDA